MTGLGLLLRLRRYVVAIGRTPDWGESSRDGPLPTLKGPLLRGRYEGAREDAPAPTGGWA